MTITHEIDREEVMAYLDGELAPARALTVRAHLDHCAECAALADDLREVSAGLGEWVVEEAPETLVAPPAVTMSRRGKQVNDLAGLGSMARLVRWMTLPGAGRWALAATSAAAVIAVLIGWNAIGRRAAQPAVADELNSVLMERAPSSRNGPISGFESASRGREAARALGYASAPTQSNLAPAATQSPAAVNTQLIVRTATVSLSTDKFDEIRASLERVAADRHGSVASLTLAGDPPNQRSMSATLRVPIVEMDAALAGVRGLGRVVQESQSSEDVTDAHRDLAIRIANARVEEARLGEILKDRTGRLSDVLAVEQAQSRVRTEIEQMEAQEIAMRNRAALSTISVEIQERYRAELADSGPLSIGTRLRNAVVDGARAALESLVGVTLAVLGAAPTLMLWAVVLFLPVRALWKRFSRRRMAA
ncbi:MAG TPA: DUF4349 domain-containing protein [Vicinamibacterales bacterium]|nr:DUF4349 domain-containing protein [Vicinamibacterales bacterium]